MRTFAQKPKAVYETKPTQTASDSTTPSRQRSDTHSILQLSRAIGNQSLQRVLRTDAASRVIEPSTTAASRLAHDFSRIPAYATPPSGSQPRLAVNAPGDIYEQEADRVAEQIMRMPAPRVQRAYTASGSSGQLCRACEEEQMAVPRKGQGGMGSAAPASVHSVLRSSGQPLSTSTRAFFEPRFRQDLSNVRVHTDGAAQQSARDVNALAYTVGSHVVFGAGRYNPSTPGGQRLLAHELTHVVQQAGSQTVGQQPILQRQEAGAEPPPDHLDRFSVDPMEILRTINPEGYCRLNCPATADAFENFVRTGRVDPAHCDRDAELRGTLGYAISGPFSERFNITPDRHGRERRLDRFVRRMESQLPAHGDVVVIEAIRTEEQRVGRSGRRLSEHHYFVLVNIRGARFVVDAYSREVRPLAQFRDYLNLLNVTYLRYVRGEFQAVARTSGAVQ